jgi:hypothetical protein
VIFVNKLLSVGQLAPHAEVLSDGSRDGALKEGSAMTSRRVALTKASFASCVLPVPLAVLLAVCAGLIFVALPGGAQTGDTPALPTAPLAPYVPLPGLPSFRAPFLRLQDPGGSRFLSFSADGLLLASTNRNDEVRVFDLKTGHVVWNWAYPELLSTSLGTIVWPFCSLAKDAWVDGKWRLTSVAGHPKGWPGDTGALFSPDHYELAVVHNPCLSNSHVVVSDADDGHVTVYPGVWLLGGYLHFFDDPHAQLRLTVEVEKPQQLPLSTTILHGLAAVTAFAYAPDGRYAVTGSSDGMLAVWDVESGNRLARRRAESLPEDAPRVNSVAFSADGLHVASIGASGTVRLWSAPFLAQEAELVGHTQPGFWVAFAPDGARVASAAMDETLRLWDPDTREARQQLNWRERVGENPIFAYHPYGAGILFGATRDDCAVAGMISDRAGAPDYTVPLDLPDIAAFAISPDGNRVALSDQAGHIWIFQTGVP